MSRIRENRRRRTILDSRLQGNDVAECGRLVRVPRESCRASSICVTSLGDSGPFWETAEGVSGSASTPLSSASGVGSGLGETCLGHLPNALSVRMLAAAMRSLVVAFSSQSLAMSRRISMSSRPLLVTSSMELAKSSAGFDGICWVEVVIGF